MPRGIVPVPVPVDVVTAGVVLPVHVPVPICVLSSALVLVMGAKSLAWDVAKAYSCLSSEFQTL